MRYRILSLFLVICTVISMVACSNQDGISEESISTTDTETETEEITQAQELRTVDLYEKAFGLSGFEKPLENMPTRAYGSLAFKDYSMLHSNPLMTASYPMEISALAKDIGLSTSGIDEFCYSVTKKYGFESDYSNVTHRMSDNIDTAIDMLYEAYGVATGIKDTKESAKRLEPRASAALAEYISVVSGAMKLNVQANKGISDEDFERIASYYYCDVATSDPSSLEFISRQYNYSNETKLLRSGLLIIKATSDLSNKLSTMNKLTTDSEELIIPTPFGDIIIGTDGNDTYSSPEAFLLIDVGGNDKYVGKVAASHSQNKPVSVLIDLDGDDKYIADKNSGATQGCGIFGAGVLFDLGGNDRYSAYRLAQGASLHGVGMLFDSEGDDKYDSRLTSQGASYFGFAALCDMLGNDSYNSMAASQAAAGTRAMAFLVDKTGNDNYYVEPYEVAEFSYLDYGQFKDVNGSWSQGCGMGQRNIDISGGLAGLVDMEGDDVYTGGIWVQGVGYWSGIGFLTDMEGNDIHNSQYYSQASVAHYGIGMLINVGGDDSHLLVEGKTDGGEGASIGFVWDRGVAMFVNDGGNDVYTFEQTCCGVAWSAYDDKGPLRQDQTYAFFIETEGDDKYAKAKPGEPYYGYGFGGFFIDASGDDKYAVPQVRQGMEKKSKSNGGVVIDHTPEDDEKAVIGIWEDAKAKYFN